MKQDNGNKIQSEKIRTLLVGTTEFAAKIFDAVLTFEDLEVVGVITQPDKAVGRRREMMAPAVKSFFLNIQNQGDTPQKASLVSAPSSPTYAVGVGDKGESVNNVQVYQPVKFRLEFEKILEETKPELIIVCAYGKILPREFIDYPKYKCLNIHGSLLPKYRGATPVQTTILNGDEVAGTTLQVMKFEMDEGDIVSNTLINIDNSSITVPILFEMLVEPTVKMLRESLPKYLSGELVPTPQDSKLASYCYISDFEYAKGELDFSKSAIEIDRKVRAFNPEPGSWVKDLTIGNLKIPGITKIISGKVHEVYYTNIDPKLGEFMIVENKLVVKSKSSYFEITKIQPTGKRVMEVRDFLNGLAAHTPPDTALVGTPFLRKGN